MVVPLILLFNHWVADFIFQTRSMAENKSKSLYWLTIHVLTYGLILSIGCAFIYIFNDISFENIIKFWSINVILHWITDFFTSKITSYFHNKKDTHKFFCVIGLDQYIHTAVMLISFQKFLT